MSRHTPVFRSIPAPLEVPDEALNALGDQLGVPKMVKPVPVPSPSIATQPENFGGAAFSETVRKNPLLEGKGSPFLGQKTTSPFRAPEPQIEKITVELPAYLTAALRREGAERRITIRTLVMMGLQALGFEVREQDLIPDGRRTHSRKSK
jgi:hypothetical protein